MIQGREANGCQQKYCSVNHRRRRRGQGGMCPLKFGKNIFRALLYKIRAFSGKNRVEFGNFANFSEKYYKNSGILLIFLARIM